MNLRRQAFPLLDRSSAALPLEAERHAWRAAEEARKHLARCARAAARERAKEFGPATEALFDLVAGTELLGSTVPSGKIAPDFARRCLEIAAARAGALRAEGEALRAAERLHAAGPIADGATALRAGIGARRWASLVRLARSYPGEPEEGVRVGELAIPGTAWIVRGRGEPRRRDAIPGSAILLGSLSSGRKGLRVARATSATARRRLGSALALVDRAWPEAGAEIRARTRLVLTLDEPGLVSYSHLDRPGVSYVNVRGKRVLDLADDLLHETAHHRLHAIEHAKALFAGKRVEAGEEPRYWSPWRRALRPVRGIYHAAYTFSFRAELFRRILETARLDETTARWVRAQAARERTQVRDALRHLDEAARDGFLTAAGKRVLTRMKGVGVRRGRGGAWSG